MLIKIFRQIYSIVFIFFIPILILKLFLRNYNLSLSFERFWERFGIFEAPKKYSGIWIHAVSLGEAMAAISVIKVLQMEFPYTTITVTTTTSSGSAVIKKEFANTSLIFHVYLPYDIPWAVQNFLRRVQPRIFIIMERELWPNLLYYCRGD